MSEPLNRQSSAFALRTWCARMYFLCSLTAAGVLGRVWSVMPQSSNWDESKVFLSAVWSNTLWCSIVCGMGGVLWMVLDRHAASLLELRLGCMMFFLILAVTSMVGLT